MALYDELFTFVWGYIKEGEVRAYVRQAAAASIPRPSSYGIEAWTLRRRGIWEKRINAAQARKTNIAVFVAGCAEENGQVRGEYIVNAVKKLLSNCSVPLYSAIWLLRINSHRFRSRIRPINRFIPMRLLIGAIMPLSCSLKSGPMDRTTLLTMSGRFRKGKQRS